MFLIKKLTLATLLLGCQVFAEPSPSSPFGQESLQESASLLLPPKRDPLLKNEEPQNSPSHDYSYLSIGLKSYPRAYRAYKDLNVLMVPDVFAGQRYFFMPHFAIDFGLGAHVHPYSYLQRFYGQMSSLAYLSSYQGAYAGLGLFAVGYRDLSVDKFSLRFYTDLHLIAGYQFDLGGRRSFVQFQMTPQKNTTVSYGFGF